ncbi:hypothetical protein GIB67_025728 [Kingdonia uniflora]|uniref:Separase-like second TPR repeats region domain-containing protein n=1 Tax=Kingdonia uniflora TaxID=39325 RepID=A0A7J7KW70_9MAGN|nr:hypothetical protein GIB67_025728 [Kingdonia uniflora]
MPRGRPATKKPILAQDVARISDKLDKLFEAFGNGAFFPSPQPPLLSILEKSSLEGNTTARSDKLNNPFVSLVIEAKTCDVEKIGVQPKANGWATVTTDQPRGETSCGADLLAMLCMKAFKEYLKSPDKDECLKFADKIFKLLRSQWAHRSSLVAQALKRLLVPLECACKDLAPINSIVGLYAAGVHFRDTGYPSSHSHNPISESSKAVSAITFFLDNGENFQNLPFILDCLRSYFHISSKEDSCLAPICVEADARNLSCPSIETNLECSVACKNKKIMISLSSYLNALAFFCDPLPASVNKAFKHILPEKESAVHACKLNYVLNVFYQFCTVFSFSPERDRGKLPPSLLVQVSISAFIISLKTGESIQRSVDCIVFIISREWIELEQKAYLLRFINNIGAFLCNNNQEELVIVISFDISKTLPILIIMLSSTPDDSKRPQSLIAEDITNSDQWSNQILNTITSKTYTQLRISEVIMEMLQDFLSKL